MDNIYIMARVEQRVQQERTTHRAQGQEIQTASAPELKFVEWSKFITLGTQPN